MATIRVGNYSNYSKCGEILVISQSGVKCRDKYVLLCILCQEMCLRFETFVRHVEQQHKQRKQCNNINLHKNYINNSSEISDDDDENKKVDIIDISGNDESDDDQHDCNDKSELESQEKNGTLLDPLDEPEVMIVQPGAHTLDNEKSSKTDNSYSVMELKQHKPMDNYTNTRTNKMDCNTKSEAECSYYDTNSDETQEESTDNDDNYDNSDDSSETKTSVNNLKSCKSNQNDAITDDNSVIIFYKTKNSMENMKNTKTTKTEPFIEKFMAKRLNVLTLITAYQQQVYLWDTNKSSKLVNRCRERREVALTEIANDIKAKVGIALSCDEVDRLIKYIRTCYIKEVRLRLQDQAKYNRADCQPLWFYEQMEFLKPTLNFIQEIQDNQLLLQTDFSEEEIITLIELYKKYPCLWNEADIYYNSEQKRQQSVKEMQQELNEALKINCTLSEVESKIELLHKVVKKEKELQFNYEQQNEKTKEEGIAAEVTTYESSNRFYEHFSFLLPHLGPFKCTYCLKIIPHIYTYRIHMAKHDGTKPFKCSICENEFTQKPGYVIHLRRHTQDFPFVCKFCNKGFPCKKELKRHFQNHAEYVKEYICDVCGEGFTQQKLLNWHLKVHSNTRDSICNICGKGFTNSKLLFQHRSVHSTDKSVCKLCGKSYAHYRGLSRHMVKDHDTTIAAVAAVLGEKPKKRVLNINIKSPLLPPALLFAQQQQQQKQSPTAVDKG